MTATARDRLADQLEVARSHGVPIRIRKFDLGGPALPSLVVGVGSARVVVAPSNDNYDSVWNIDGENHKRQDPVVLAVAAGVDRDVFEAIAEDLQRLCDRFVDAVDEDIAELRRAAGARLMLELG